jgi:hypothetical protein
METFALSLPLSVGLKVTVMVQDFPGPTLESHVLLCENSSESVPVIVMPLMLRVVVPTLISVVGTFLLWPT